MNESELKKEISNLVDDMKIVYKMAKAAARGTTMAARLEVIDPETGESLEAVLCGICTIARHWMKAYGKEGEK